MPSFQALLQQARSLLETTNSPDAILAAADGSALPAPGAARELGHHVGQDLLVPSSIGSPAMRFVTPATTAIEAPPRDIGQDSARYFSKY